MIKIITAFSKKVPTNENQYEMIDFFASIEREVLDSLSRDERQRIKQDDYSEMKEDVQNQIDTYRKSVSAPRAVPQATNASTQQKPQAQRITKPASIKQITWITNLSKKLGLSNIQVAEQLRQAFGISVLKTLSETLKQLTTKQAGEYIKSQQEQQKTQTQQPANHHNNGKTYHSTVTKPISTAQISLIQKMADERDYSCEQMTNKLNAEYGVSGLEQLNQKQASDLINKFPRVERSVS